MYRPKTGYPRKGLQLLVIKWTTLVDGLCCSTDNLVVQGKEPTPKIMSSRQLDYSCSTRDNQHTAGHNFSGNILGPLYYSSDLGLIIAGYWDKVAGVNLLHLVGLWRETQLNGETLSEQYPDAAEYFQIRVVSSGDQAHLRDILPEFDGCPYIKIWCMGDEINLQPNLNG